ncbi:hypothetical protein [Acinetobacter haemolyticus]|uniref:Lipoprotein n=1 Tax=Acinetobacter haemolyticus TaxID=29430 RepID=A0A4P7B4S6_ACIHA|nr:hypothetical protein [Acinetobacter haemolyticus]QBQ16505.1 hypothetical protein AHTJR_09535 [Acinetobacter haemolyticus]
MKKFILIGLLPFLISGCNAKPTPQQELTIQAKFLPTIVGIDAGVYALASQQKPTPLTIQLFDSALFKAGLLMKYENEVGNNFSIEDGTSIVKINSLCLMGKFLKSPDYQDTVKMDKKYHADLYRWLDTKQKKWETLLKNEGADAFDYSCIS